MYVIIACVVCPSSTRSFLRNSFRWKKCLSNRFERWKSRLIKKLGSSTLLSLRNTSLLISFSLAFLLQVHRLAFVDDANRPIEASSEMRFILVKDFKERQTILTTIRRCSLFGRSFARKLVIFSSGLFRQPWLLCPWHP